MTTLFGINPNEDGIHSVEISSWNQFREYIINLRGNFIWRGQCRDRDNTGLWLLTSSFDRSVVANEVVRRDDLLQEHLENFKKEMRKTHRLVLPKDEDDIWALGQHYGLKTLFPDWSLSPYIAAYFAFEKPPASNDDYRYVYALNRSVTRLLSKKGTQSDRVVGVVDKLAYENPRFRAQKGIFTKVLEGRNLETAVSKFSQKRPKKLILVKLRIATTVREECLWDLQLMGINHTTLLLDLREVTHRCNQTLEKQMNTTKYVYWQDGDTWLGYLEEYPDYRTQGGTKEELQENLKDIYKELTSGSIPSVRKLERLEVA